MDFHASTLGVADPMTSGNEFFVDLSIAICLAWYLGDDPDLYDESCSSSIMISPRSGTGAKTALLAPTTTLASFLRILFHSPSLWLGVSSLWSTAAIFPNLFTTASITCGVSPISGTR